VQDWHAEVRCQDWHAEFRCEEYIHGLHHYEKTFLLMRIVGMVGKKLEGRPGHPFT
jgi:hypothetical protein